MSLFLYYTVAPADYAEILVESGDETETLYSNDGGDDWGTHQAELSELEGDDVTVRFETEDDAELETDFVSVLNDSSGSGLPDAVETMDLKLPAGGPDMFGEPLSLDPHRADTSGDGLEDGDVVDIEWAFVERADEWVLEAEVTEAHAHPAYYDTAGNGLSDYEELEIGTDPFLMDTSGDGLIDSVDPNPLEQNTPPDVRYESVGFFEDELAVDVRPTGAADAVEETTVRKSMDQTRVPVYMGSVTYDAEWQNETFHDLGTDGDWETVRTDLRDERGGPSQLASEFAVEAVDDDGNAILIEYDIENESATVAALAASEIREDPMAAATGFGAAGTGFKTVTIPAEKLLVGGGVGAAVGAPAAVAYLSAQPVEGDAIEEPLEQTVPATGILNENEWNHPELEEDIRLPSGATYEHDSSGIERSHGNEQITQLPGIDGTDDVREVIRAPSVHEESGEFDLIIGDNPNGDGQIALWILDGIVISAAEIIENPQGVDDEFVIPEDKSHIEDREQKHITKNQEIRRIIENADEVYTNGQGLFVWVLYEDGKAKIVHGYDHTGLPTDFERIVLSTAYERSEEPREFVERLKESKQLDRIYP